MKTCIIYKEENGWYLGHIQEYPDYESQGTTIDELKGNLLELKKDWSLMQNYQKYLN